MKGGKQQFSVDLPTAAEDGDRPAAEELSPDEEDVAPNGEEVGYEDFPTEEDGDAGKGEEDEEERPKLDEGFYEIEAVRRKRVRKGVSQYLIKWRGWPETSNTWEPLENLLSCSDVIDSYEESLKTGKFSSRKRRRRSAAAQLPVKKRQQTRSPAAPTPSDKALTRENPPSSSPIEDSVRVEEVKPVSDRAIEAEESELNLKISELKVSAATNGDTLRSQVPEEGGPANDTLLSGRCIGAKRRKSGSVKRFKLEAGASTIDGAQDVLAPNAFCGMGANQGIQNGTSGTPKTMYDGSRITELLKPVSCTTTTNNNTKDVLVIFHAKRSDGGEIMVDNKFLKSNYPDLLINFYEQHLRYTPT